MLKETNRLVQQFRYVADLPEFELANKKFVLRSDIRPAGTHERTYNQNIADEVALVSLNTEMDPQEVRIYPKNDECGGFTTINNLNPDYAPLHYTLLFPEGDQGWGPKRRLENGKAMSTAAYYRYMIQHRKDSFNSILRSGKLMSEYICNAWFQVENHKLTYMKTHQKEIKAESYQNLHDALSAREDVTQVGDRVILAPSHTGSPRWYQVWPLTQFFSISFCKKSLICLEGKSKTPFRENSFFFCSSQQLPCLRLRPLKSFFS